MPNPWTEFHRERDRRNPATFIAYVDATAPQNADGSYNVIRIDTNERVRASRSRDGDHYAAGTAVEVSNPSASFLNRNSGYTILGLAGLSLRNLSETSLTTTTTTKTGVAVYSLSPSPLTLEQGQSGTLTIRGVGFTAAPTFTSGYLTVTASSVTSTLITITVQASPLATPGRYEMVLSGQTFSDAVRVAETVSRLWVFEMGTAHHVKLKAGTGEQVLSGSRSADVSVYGAADADTAVYAAGIDIHKITAATGAASRLAVAGASAPSQQCAYANGYVYMITAGAVLKKFDGTTGAVVDSVALVNGDFGLVYDGTDLWCGSTAGLIQVNPATLARTAHVVGGVAGGDWLAFDGTDIYAADTASSKVHRITRAGVLAGTATAVTSVAYIAASNGYVYGVKNSANGLVVDAATIYKIRTSDMTVTATATATTNQGARRIEAGCGLVYVAFEGAGAVAPNRGTVAAYHESDLSTAWTWQADAVGHYVTTILLT